MTKIYFKGGRYNKLSKLILDQSHTLIGGTTRAGKSVLLNTIICDSMHLGALYYFIDLKGVELDTYKKTPFCLGYCDRIGNVESVIDNVIATMENRFQEMKVNNQRKHTGLPVYLVIDEYVDIKYSKDISSSAIENKIMRIVSKGAAANVHVILCTQHCTSKTLTTNIKALFVSKVGLRTVNAQESRNIIGENGCESLPMHGECLIRTPDYRDLTKWNITRYDDETIVNKVKDFIEYNKEMRRNERKGKLFWWM